MIHQHGHQQSYQQVCSSLLRVLSDGASLLVSSNGLSRNDRLQRKAALRFCLYRTHAAFRATMRPRQALQESTACISEDPYQVRLSCVSGWKSYGWTKWSNETIEIH